MTVPLFSENARRGGAASLLVAVSLSFLSFLASGCPRGSSGGSSPANAANARPQTQQPLFVDMARAAGLDYTWSIAGKRPLNILQTIGNGCAFLDYDNDGNLDVLLVGPRIALFRGDGAGKFTDVSAQAGLSKLSGHFLGCAVGDIDNDGFADVYVSGYRTGVLLKNAGGKAFRDVSRSFGLLPQPWGTSCGFADLDGDGYLDLYVANYADFGPDTQPRLCPENNILTSCGPRHYRPIQGTLYLSQNGKRFRDATKPTGALAATGKGLGVAILDFTGDGRPGIAIANDEMPGDLLQAVAKAGKTGTPRYENIGEISGTAYDRDGNVHGGMGADWGDYDNDGKPDLFVATFQNEMKPLYRNEGEGRFTDTGLAAGLGPATTATVAFGCKFFDYDNDGWLDLVIANGHVQDNIQQIQPTMVYRQAAVLLRNKGDSPTTFEDVSKTVGGPDLTRPIVGRGLATGDYDNDGRVDLLVVDSEGKPLLLHNEGGPARHWLGVRLVGTKSNRSGYGATLSITVGGKTLTRHCRTDGSYLSASDPRVHFGLGDKGTPVDLTVRWPGGRVERFAGLPADRYVTLREGTAPAQKSASR